MHTEQPERTEQAPETGSPITEKAQKRQTVLTARERPMWQKFSALQAPCWLSRWWDC